jgi:hypothetical protein
LQRVLDFGPLLAGLAFLPLTGTIFIVTRWVPGIVARFGALLPLAIGGAAVTGSFLLWAPLTEDSSYAAVVIPLIIQALGVALIFTAGTLTAMNAVPEADTGSASGMLQMVQQVGGSIGIAVAVSVYASGAIQGEFVPGFAGAMFAGAGLALLGTVVALLTVGKNKHAVAQPEEERHA